MRLINRGLADLLCLVVIFGIIPLDTTTVKAEPLPPTKTVSVIVKQSGVHDVNNFPAERSYDDGQYAGILSRQDDTLESVVRAKPIVTYIYQSDVKYPIDKPAAGQFSFPATYAASYYDSASGQYFSATLTKSGSPYFSGAVTVTPLYWDHEGYEYDPVNNTKLGYMSNNSSTYYSGQCLYSDPPRRPVTYYGPPAEDGLGWVQYKAPEWDGALQDAEKEPWRSICLFEFGVARFRSVSGNFNRYRKPVRIFYSRTTSIQYIYQKYSGTATVMDTEITYTGIVFLQLPDPPDLPDLTFGDDSTILSSYYAGKDIVISIQVKNLTAQSVPSVDVRLQIGAETKTEQICVPGNGINIAVFRITTPTELGTYPVILTIDPYDKILEQPPDGEHNNQSNAIGTIRYDGSSGSIKIDIVELVRNDLPDPADLRMEADHYTRNKSAPVLPTLAKSTLHVWTEYRYENGQYVKKSY